jgi:hypothetical protein
MTIRMPEANILDRFLKFLGKKRGVGFPGKIYEKFGPYAYANAPKESFWKALLRPANQPLPDGLVDLFQIEDFRKEVADTSNGE